MAPDISVQGNALGRGTQRKCAECGAIEFEGFSAAAAEEEVRLDLGGGHGGGIVLVRRNQSQR